jgi:hypothetical protein
VRGEDTAELLPLEEVQRRLRTFEQAYLGVRPIPVGSIVGTVERGRDFDREFLPRRRDVGGRWNRVERAFPEGDFPPIVVYQVGEAYFVVDGHHRVAIARQRGMATIDAEVTRLRSRYPLPADADIGRLIMAEQEREFMEESGLERSRPEVRIEFSRPTGYPELLEQVKVHGYHLMQERGRVLPPEEVAADWYDRVYLPAVQAIRAQSLVRACPHTPEGDLFLAVQHRRLAMVPERGGVGVEEAARRLKEEVEARRLKARARRAVRRLPPVRVLTDLASRIAPEDPGDEAPP